MENFHYGTSRNDTEPAPQNDQGTRQIARYSTLRFCVCTTSRQAR